MSSPARLEKILDYLKISANKLSVEIGLKDNVKVYHIKNGRNEFSPEMSKAIHDRYPEISYKWILSGKGEMLHKGPESDTRGGKRDLDSVNELTPKEYATHIAVKLVSTKARAGFAGAYYADEYLESMPSVLIEADREYKGKYLAFEVDGDSMEPEYIKGDVVICREVKRDLWQYKLHINEWDFVIAHGTKGIMLKEITDHNTETGEITCHSINTAEHPDFKLNLREVAYLYNVVEVRRSGRSKRRNR